MGRSYLPEDWQRDASVSPAARCLMGVLSSYAASESGDQDVWPSPTTVAKDLGMGQRHIRRLGDELENAGWLTRIYEKSVRGGTDLTWRIHFPVISRSGYGADTERTHKSVEGPNRRTRSGHGADTEGTHRSARIEGEKVGRDEGSSTVVDEGSLTLTPPALKKPTKASRRRKAQTDDEMHEAADKCPSEQDAVAHAIEKGLAPSERWWAEAWWHRWEERRWIRTDRAGNRQPVGNWKSTLTTALKYAVADRPSLKGRQDTQHTPTINGEIDAWGKR